MKKYCELVGVWAQVVALKVWKYAKNVVYAGDKFANAILCGDPDETISSRLGKWLRDHPGHCFAAPVCWVLSLFDKNHCTKAINDQEGDDAIFR